MNNGTKNPFSGGRCNRNWENRPCHSSWPYITRLRSFPQTSRQFYAEMNIGTAVPAPEELQMVPHHFIQHKNIQEPYSVGDFERDALALLEQLYKVHDLVIMVGGSGLYIDAVLYGMDSFPKIDPSVREALNKELELQGLGSLQEELTNADPDYAQKSRYSKSTTSFTRFRSVAS